MSSNDKLDLLRNDLEQIAARLADGHRLLVLGEMSATLAHDLNNQLTVVLSCASHLRLANGAVMDGEAREEGHDRAHPPAFRTASSALIGASLLRVGPGMDRVNER